MPFRARDTPPATAKLVPLLVPRVDTSTPEITLALRPVDLLLGSLIMAIKQKANRRKEIRRTRTRSSSGQAAAGAKKNKMRRYVYYFGDGHADGSGSMKPLLGGKGAN